ncbi:MAG: tetratricopeptide repeat protein [Myxococcota bacterium]
MFGWWIAATAAGASLPGVAVPFDVDPTGRWVLASDLPAPLATAGAKPGWVLVAVDDVAFTNGADAERQVADGGSRSVRLRFRDETPPPAPKPAPKGKAPPPPPPAPETVLVVRRSALVHAEPIGVVAFPDGFARPAGLWSEDPRGDLSLVDAAGHAWTLTPAGPPTGSSPGIATWAASTATESTPALVPDVFWSLSDAPWVVIRADGVHTGTVAWARGEFGSAARVRGWSDRLGDHLLVATPDGLEVVAVEFPSGTPTLPTCDPGVPETCLASGRQILAELGARQGAGAEALRQLGIACANGVHRGCYEAVALQQPELKAPVGKCIDDADIASCNQIATQRFDLNPEAPDALALGLLEYACELEGSGSLGERLRRIEDVASGCMRLATAYDGRNMPDLALLNLDQACVLGRADACEQATERRRQAFAARTVRECEDPELPVAASCVELGRLLQDEDRPIAVATLDDFGAFLRGCSLGATDGCVNLGDYVDRWGIDNPRVIEAEQQLQQSCTSGEQRACLGVAHLLVRHEPRTDAYAQALVLFNSACQSGLGAACVAGAEQRRIGTARRVDAPDQDAMWTLACDRQSADGCAGLGDRYTRKKDDWVSAFGAWSRACELGEPHACSELGQLVERDHEPAWDGEQAPAAYLQRGCDNGDPEGCYWLAEQTLPPKGEPPEPTYLLLDRSCEGQYGPGCASLAEVHIARETSFDDEIAARHFDTACDNGHYESCKTLGLMYLRGKGVERDRQKANELLDRFRLNAQRKYLRIGVNLGIAQVAGGEAELVIPTPVGPALSVSGAYSYVPQLGTFMVLLDGDPKPAVSPDLRYLGATVRLYPNHQARGLFGAVGFHQLDATGGDLTENRTRIGWNARLGLRNDAKFLYSGIEMGFGQYGDIEMRDFDEGEDGVFPLILPSFAITFGLAPF